MVEDNLDHPSSKSINLRQSLGGGEVADVLLWKRPRVAMYVLGVATLVWYTFEIAEYNFLSLISKVLIFMSVLLFFWAKSATLLNRPLPPLPKLEISEESARKGADAVLLRVNHVLEIARYIALGRDLKLFLKVAVGLWLVAQIGNLFNFLSLVYIGVVLSLTVPALYNKYQAHVDEKFYRVHEVLSSCFREFNNTVISKIPIPINKAKKIQ